MASQSDESEALEASSEEVDSSAADDATEAAEEETAATPASRELWEETGITPVEIALPSGVGLTLRAYRKVAEVTPTEVQVDEDDPFEARRIALEQENDADDEDQGVIVDEEYEALLAEDDKAKSKAKQADDDSEDDEDADDDAEPADEDLDAALEEEEAKQPDDEEVPVFLTHKGKLILFKTPEALVSFIRSGAPHDLAQLASWATVAERVQSSDVEALEDDSYELDLVVENLRGGHDTWDFPLLITAGEIARDLGYAMLLKPVILALSPGSPLDDLDEALRTAEGGGMSGFFGRRKLKKFGAQQASLGWRSIISKISAAVDWRD